MSADRNVDCFYYDVIILCDCPEFHQITIAFYFENRYNNKKGVILWS